MPEETYWESFFKPKIIFSKLQLDKEIENAAEFGSGYGTFTIQAAKIIKGKIFAFDIDRTMIDQLEKKVIQEKLNNVKICLRDFVKEGTGLDDGSVNYVMLFNILHAKNPNLLLNEAYRILENKGKMGVIHWIHSESTPRGPSMDIRPKPEQIKKWMKATGFKSRGDIIKLPPYHYGLLGIKE